MATVETSHIPATIKEAYYNLSQEGFAVWIRLHVCNEQSLAEGRGKLARRLGYSEARSNEILRELSLAGYVVCIPGPRPATPTTVKILRRCKISGRNSFVRLSRTLDYPSDLTVKNSELSNDLAAMTVGLNRLAKTTVSDHFQGGSDGDQMPPLKTNIAGEKAHTMSKNETIKKHASTAGGHEKKRTKRVKFLTPSGGIVVDVKPGHERETIVHYRESKLDLVKFDPKERRAKRALQKQRAIKRPAAGKPIDWSRLDKVGKPAVTFDLDDKERARAIALLTTDTRKLTTPERKLRKQVERKYTTAFIRIYELYRKDVQRSNGNTHVAYGVMDNERKYALRAAIACIVKGVTPRQVLEYWHKNIGDFANANMSVPPLPFLAQPAMIDTVTIAAMAARHDVTPRAKRRGRAKGRSMHTMSDVSLLHRDLRRALMGAGFDLSEINDKYLTAIQAYAVDVVSGSMEANVIPSKLRAMVKWAAENIYHGVDVDDFI